MPFVPGQFVLCRYTFRMREGFSTPKAGTVYTVRFSRVGAGGHRFIALREILNPICGVKEPAFWDERFVPIDDKALDIFRQVLTDAPMDEETV